MSEEKYITMYGNDPFIIYNDYWSKMREKDIEIERLNKELETLKQPQVFIDTQDMEERYGEELYKEYLEKENKRLNNIINELEKYCNEEIEDYDKHINSKFITDIAREQYEGEKVCFEDMLDKLQELKGSDKSGKS